MTTNIEGSNNNDGFNRKHKESIARMQSFSKTDTKASPYCDELIDAPFGVSLLKLIAGGRPLYGRSWPCQV